MFNFIRTNDSKPRGARGYRAYVVGDIHGRLDLLNRLLRDIERDLAASSSHKVMLVFLGDLIDRGPQSAQVIERLRTYRRRGVETMFLLGNHEEVLLRILEGDSKLITKWRWYGGSECLESYGVDLDLLKDLDEEGVLEVVREAIPQEHVDFLRSFSDTCRFGDYLFVHAGIRPGVSIDQQLQTHLRWIREPFLVDDTDHGCVVMHGHTISPQVEERANRIGIDTGSYRSGVLSALAIEGEQRWYLDTSNS